MRKGEIWNLLNKIIWSSEKESYYVIFLDRKEPNFRKVVRGDKIKKVTSDGLVEISGEALIPLHRVIEIRYRDSVIFARKSRLSSL